MSAPRWVKRLGDKVNIELDPQTQAIVDTTERVLAQKMQQLQESLMPPAPTENHRPDFIEIKNPVLIFVRPDFYCG